MDDLGSRENHSGLVSFDGVNLAGRDPGQVKGGKYGCV
jgi:hypothetical protein